MSLQSAEIVSLRILDQVKENVPGCGKEMDALIMGADGSLIRKNQSDYRYQLKILDAYDSMATLLFPFATDLDIPDSERQFGFWIAQDAYKRKLSLAQAERLAEQQDSGEE
jgi:hypothetical protein